MLGAHEKLSCYNSTSGPAVCTYLYPAEQAQSRASATRHPPSFPFRVSYGATLGRLSPRAEHTLPHSSLSLWPARTASCSFFRFSPAPSTRSLTALFSSLADGPAFLCSGSRPTEQLSLGERRLCLSLVVGVTLAADLAQARRLAEYLTIHSFIRSFIADLTQARRLGDARFLFLWGSFHAPMGLSLWACSAGGAAKAKALASKLTLAGVEA